MTEIEQAVAAEVAQVVAWLEELEKFGAPEYVRHSIERGEYKETSGE